MDWVLVALAFHRVTKSGLSPLGGLNNFVLYDFATDTVQGYTAEWIVPVKPQELDDHSVLLVISPTIDVNCPHDVTRKTASEIERNYQLYRVVTDDDERQPKDVLADEVEDLNDIFAQEAL